MTITATLLGFLWSFLASSALWLLLAVAFGVRKNLVVLTLVFTVALFGLEVVFGITGGLMHIWNVGWLALLNSQFNVFTLGAILALSSIVAAVVSAVAVFIVEAMER